MSVKLRLRRMGAKKRPFYRIVASDSRSPRDGRFIEVVGSYNPITEPAEVKINKELVMKWLSTGAIPTDTVRGILSKQGIMKEFHESKKVSAPKATKKVVKKAPVKAAKKETTKKVTKKASK